MKLRIRGDSLRLRLKRGEVGQIAAGRRLEEQTRFPGSALTYCLETAQIDDIEADFADGRLVVRLPETQVGEWASTDEVSLTGRQQLADGITLSLLVEKDFACIIPGHHRDDEDDEDTYPHPSVKAKAV